MRHLAIFVSLALAFSGAAAADRIIDTVAGGGPNNVPATEASLSIIFGIGSDPSGNLFIPDGQRATRPLGVFLARGQQNTFLGSESKN